MKKISFFILLLFIFSACTVVRTNYSEKINQKNKNILYYYLPETLLKIHATAKVDEYYLKDSLFGAITTERTYAFTPEIIANTQNLLVLEYRNNGLFSDDLSFTVNDKGLLTNLKIDTKDETATIVETLSKTLDGIKILTNTVKTEPDGVKIESKEYKNNYVVKVSEIDKNGIKVPWVIEVVNKNNPKRKIDLVEDYLIKTPNNTPKPFDFSNLPSEKTEDKVVDGIITRPIQNLKIVVLTKENTEIPSFVQVADVSKVLVLPMKRTAFVKTTNEMVISNGIISSNKITRPSPVNGFAQIPVSIAKAIVSIPAQLIQVRINKNTSEKSLLTSEKERLEKELDTKIKLMQINNKLDSLSRIK